MNAKTATTIIRRGQNVTFTTDETGSLVQTSPFRSSTDGKPIPLLDYEIDGTRIIASNAGIARQAHQQWKTDTDAEDTMTETAEGGTDHEPERAS